MQQMRLEAAPSHRFLRHHLAMSPRNLSRAQTLLRQTDLLQLWLPILDAHALARLSVQPPPRPPCVDLFPSVPVSDDQRT